MAGTDDKLMFPRDGFDKRRLFEHYTNLSGTMAPHVYARFLTLHRFPDGIAQTGFYQQRWSEHFSGAVGRQVAKTADGRDSIAHLYVENAAGLGYLADQGTIELHGWLSCRARPALPDKILFDLDPDEHPFGSIAECARRLGDVLRSVGLVPFVMTTGSRGLHVAAPLAPSRDFDSTRALARAIAQSVAETAQDHYTTEQRKKARRGRLYIDTSRNAYGQTSILPYSLRARDGAPVATPLDWDELSRADMGPQRYGLANIRRRLAQKPDPWRDFFEHAARPKD